MPRHSLEPMAEKELSLEGHPGPFCFGATTLGFGEGGSNASYKSFVSSVELL